MGASISQALHPVTANLAGTEQVLLAKEKKSDISTKHPFPVKLNVSQYSLALLPLKLFFYDLFTTPFIALFQRPWAKRAAYQRVRAHLKDSTDPYSAYVTTQPQPKIDHYLFKAETIAELQQALLQLHPGNRKSLGVRQITGVYQEENKGGKWFLCAQALFRSVDVEPEGDDLFSYKAIRNRFVQKVYGILTAQFLLTFAICVWFIFTPSIKIYIQQNQWVLIVSLVFFFVTAFTLICCQELQRTVPWNYILLTFLTVSMSFMLGVICAFSQLDAVMIAAGITFVTTLAVSLFSCWTKFDFTKLIWIAVMCGFVLMIAGIVAMFWANNIFQILYVAAGSVICVLYLAIDTQMVMGNRTYVTSEEDYIVATLHLYLDIIQLFLYILKFVKALQKD